MDLKHHFSIHEKSSSHYVLNGHLGRFNFFFLYRNFSPGASEKSQIPFGGLWEKMRLLFVQNDIWWIFQKYLVEVSKEEAACDSDEMYKKKNEPSNDIFVNDDLNLEQCDHSKFHQSLLLLWCCHLESSNYQQSLLVGLHHLSSVL